MQPTRAPLIASLIIVSLTVGIGIGYFFNPQYQLAMYEKAEMDLGQADRWIDLRYIDAMIAHHRGAMLLAEQVLNTTQRQELNDLAKEILATEPKLIDELYGWKKDWYGDQRTVRDPQVARLGQYDATFDLRFLNALIAHHDSGIVMTQDVRMKSSRAEILNNADAVEKFLTTTGAVLRDWRTTWYTL